MTLEELNIKFTASMGGLQSQLTGRYPAIGVNNPKRYPKAAEENDTADHRRHERNLTQSNEEAAWQ